MLLSLLAGIIAVVDQAMHFCNTNAWLQLIGGLLSERASWLRACEDESALPADRKPSARRSAWNPPCPRLDTGAGRELIHLVGPCHSEPGAQHDVTESLLEDLTVHVASCNLCLLRLPDRVMERQPEPGDTWTTKAKRHDTLCLLAMPK